MRTNCGFCGAAKRREIFANRWRLGRVPGVSWRCDCGWTPKSGVSRRLVLLHIETGCKFVPSGHNCLTTYLGVLRRIDRGVENPRLIVSE